jgi:hypothetical protein
MLLLLPVTRDDVMSWRCFAFSTEEWSALSLSVFFTYMYMNNLTSTHNNLPLTQLSEPLFSTGYEPSLISSASTVPLSISLLLEMSTKDLFKHPQGTFERLTSTNYASWKNNMTRLLQALGVWKVINGTEVRPHDPVRDEYFDRQGYFDRDAFEYDVRRAHRKIEKFEALCATANAALYNACSVSVRVYIDAIESPSQIWTTLQQRLDSTSTSVGRQALYSAFSELRPKPGAPIGDYFSQLLEIRNQIVGTNEAISDAAFKTHLFKTLPPVFAITAKIQQNRTDNPSIEQIIDALKQDEAARSIETLPDAATEAFHSAGPARRHVGNNAITAVRTTGAPNRQALAGALYVKTPATTLKTAGTRNREYEVNVPLTSVLTKTASTNQCRKRRLE